MRSDSARCGIPTPSRAPSARSRLLRNSGALIGAALTLAAPSLAEAGPVIEELRVCSDPNNLPFSNRAGEGFENALAEIVADELGVELSYTWWAQRRGFIRNTLNAGECNLVMGVPADYELVDTTRPYYRSRYVFVYPMDDWPELTSITDPRLRHLRIAVHLTGDDGANPPPVHALGSMGIVDNVIGYMIYGDYRDATPTADPIEAVGDGQADVAAVWGPIGAYFARRVEPPLVVRGITDTEAFAGLPFEFSISVGVRKGDTELRDEINRVLERRRDDVRSVLLEYAVPLVEPIPANARGPEEARP